MAGCFDPTTGKLLPNILGSVIGRRSRDANSQPIIPGMPFVNNGKSTDTTRCRGDALGDNFNCTGTLQ
jgi:hypothetical protein